VPDLLAGSTVKALDFPPTVDNFDNTSIDNITATTYQTGSPEVGVTFTGPTTGRVKITVGGGVRNNGSNDDRVVLSPQVFEDDSSGTEVLAPSVAQRGCSSVGGFTNNGFQYLDRTSLLENLTPGQTYYARVQYLTNTGAGTCDISARSIIVEPAT
jgi:hypothetical protein